VEAEEAGTVLIPAPGDGEEELGGAAPGSRRGEAPGYMAPRREACEAMSVTPHARATGPAAGDNPGAGYPVAWKKCGRWWSGVAWLVVVYLVLVRPFHSK